MKIRVMTRQIAVALGSLLISEGIEFTYVPVYSTPTDRDDAKIIVDEEYRDRAMQVLLDMVLEFQVEGEDGVPMRLFRPA